MTDMAVQYLALIYASVARIEGMKAHNSEREARGAALAYGPDEFHTESQNLQHLADQIRDQRTT